LADVIIVVDTLSFSTAVDVSVSAGAQVWPFRWQDARAQAFARERGAVLAGSREAGGISLSPSSLLNLAPNTRLVLPSPNGGTLCAAAQDTGAKVYAACLRNAEAVAVQVPKNRERVLVVPAGERWTDGTLRPALEDQIGAGAVVHLLRSGDSRYSLSPEAQAAEAVFLSVQAHLEDTLKACSSGRELMLRGFAGDVTLAAQFGVSRTVPLLMDGSFVNAAALLDS